MTGLAEAGLPLKCLDCSVWKQVLKCLLNVKFHWYFAHRVLYGCYFTCADQYNCTLSPWITGDSRQREVCPRQPQGLLWEGNEDDKFVVFSKALTKVLYSAKTKIKQSKIKFYWIKLD